MVLWVAVKRPDGWGLSAPRGLGWEWRLATEFAASNELRALGGEETTAAAATAASAAAAATESTMVETRSLRMLAAMSRLRKKRRPPRRLRLNREEERKAVEAYDAEQKRMLREEALILFDMWRCVALGCVMASSARAWTQTHNLARQFWNSVSALRLSPADYVRLARAVSQICGLRTLLKMRMLPPMTKAPRRPIRPGSSTVRSE